MDRQKIIRLAKEHTAYEVIADNYYESSKGEIVFDNQARLLDFAAAIEAATVERLNMREPVGWVCWLDDDDKKQNPSFGNYEPKAYPKRDRLFTSATLEELK